MGQNSVKNTCDGCNRTTPFFGELYGRMSEDAHGSPGSRMCHGIVDIDNDEYYKDFDAFNTFKNKTLIPFYGTVVAIKTIIGAMKRDMEMIESVGLSYGQCMYINRQTETKAWFLARLIIAMVPIVGTIINGALDIIAQVGLYLKTAGSSSVEAKVEEIET